MWLLNHINKENPMQLSKTQNLEQSHSIINKVNMSELSENTQPNKVVKVTPFRYTHLCNSGKLDLYARFIDLTFVILISGEDGDKKFFKQFFLHRHKAADLLLGASQSNQEKSVLLAKDILLVAKPATKEPALFLRFDSFELQFMEEESGIRETLLSDWAILKKIREIYFKTRSFRDRKIELFLGLNKELTTLNPPDITDRELEALTFERSLEYKNKRLRKADKLSYIYGASYGMETELSMDFKLLIGKKLILSPDDKCGRCHDTCGCDLVEKTSRKYFPHAVKNKDGIYSGPEFDSDFDKFNKITTNQQKALLTYVEDDLEPNPLLDMNFWSPDFDVDKYVSVRSNDGGEYNWYEERVRKSVTVAHYFVELNRDRMPF